MFLKTKYMFIYIAMILASMVIVGSLAVIITATGLVVAVNCVFLVLLSAILGVLAFLNFMNKESAKTIALINENCDPYAFLAELKTLNYSKKYANWLAVNFSVAYSDMGQLQYMKQELDKAIPFSKVGFDRKIKIAYLNNSISLYTQIGDFVSAEALLGDLFLEISATKNVMQYDAYYWIYANARQSILAQQGDFAGTEILAKLAFERSKDERSRVMAQWMLARTYLYYGRKQEAIAALQYVVAKGNRLYVVEQAAILLEQLRT